MSSVHCGIAPPAAVRLLESESRHFSKFTVLGFLPSTADASVVHRHGCVHLGIEDFFFEFYSSRSAVFRLNRLTSGRIELLTIIIIIIIIILLLFFCIGRSV